MRNLSSGLGRTLGLCATLVAAVVLLPVMAFLIVALRMVLLPVAVAVAVLGLLLVFFGPARFRAWICTDWADGERR